MNQFVQVDGEDFRAGGKKIFFRGFGAGSWMNLEHFMIGLPGTDRLIHRAFRDVFGEARAEDFFDRFLTEYLGDADFAFLRDLGVNLLRLPVNYRYFYSSETGEYLEDGFRYLDRVLALCEKYGIYAVIDMHAAPGGQNPDWHCDTDCGLPLFWEYSALRDVLAAVWGKIAARYRDNARVAGYDILNEPSFAPEDLLKDFYAKTLKAIRRTDENHIVFLEGNNFAREFDSFDEPSDPQIAYSCHYYPSVVDPSVLDESTPEERRAEIYREAFRPLVRIREKYHRPVWCGELGLEFDREHIRFQTRLVREMLDVCEQNNVSWTLWAYKDAQCMGIVAPESSAPWMRFVSGIRKEWDQSQEMRMGGEAVDLVCAKYLRPVDDGLRYRLQFRMRTLFHTVCVEQYLKPALARAGWEEIVRLPESFRFENCFVWDEMRSLVISYTLPGGHGSRLRL